MTNDVNVCNQRRFTTSLISPGWMAFAMYLYSCGDIDDNSQALEKKKIYKILDQIVWKIFFLYNNKYIIFLGTTQRAVWEGKYNFEKFSKLEIFLNNKFFSQFSKRGQSSKKKLSPDMTMDNWIKIYPHGTDLNIKYEIKKL